MAFTRIDANRDAIQLVSENFAELCKAANIKVLPNGVTEHVHLNEKGEIVDYPTERMGIWVETTTGKQLLLDNEWLIKDKSGVLSISKTAPVAVK